MMSVPVYFRRRTRFRELLRLLNFRSDYARFALGPKWHFLRFSQRALRILGVLCGPGFWLS
jgi:hypothetical protein